ncbi:MAG: LURP-one-related family protein [Firmicutes bacterium]|nr:LURP-one-related family protein [Bacillota bacterium]
MIQHLFLKQKVFSLTEDFTFFDEFQRPIFRARGNFFAFPKQYKMFDAVNQVNPMILIRRKFFAFMPTFTIIDTSNNQTLFTVRQRFRLGRPIFDIATPHGNYMIDGNLIGHDFAIMNPNGRQVIQLNKRFLTWGDAYDVAIDTSQIPLHVAAAIILTIDCALHSSNR